VNKITDEKELQEKYLKYQTIEKQMQKINQQIQEIDGKLLELEFLKQSLAELSNTKKGTEVLAPLSSGIFLKANLTDNEELLVNVGKNTVVSKTVPQTIELMDEQVKHVEELRNQLIEQLQNIGLQGQMLENELKELTKNV